MMCIQRLTLTGLATLCTVTAGLVFSNVPALALPVHAFTASFGGLGAGNAQFKEPGGVAVNDSTGQVYVVDKGNNRVEYFSSSGAYEGQFNGSDAPKGPFSEPTAVAVNQSDGDVWIVD